MSNRRDMRTPSSSEQRPGADATAECRPGVEGRPGFRHDFFRPSPPTRNRIRIGRGQRTCQERIGRRNRPPNLYRRLNHRNSIDFFRQLQGAFPFRIRQLQTDNGNEFSLAFRLTVEEAGIEYRYRYIRPRRPQQNGKVERSHRVDHEEFSSRQRLTSYGQAESALRAWEQHYNVERFSMALQGQTPAEKLAARLAA